MSRGPRWRLRSIVWLLSAGLLAAPALTAADGAGAAITYRRVFKGSNPEFIEIKVSEDGPASFDIRQLSEDADPQPLEVGPAVRAKIFELAASLKDFDGADFDVHRKIANLGQKTFRYEKDGVVHETHFNYTTNHGAAQLMMIFEGLSQQQQDLAEIERKLKFDRLGLNDALLQFENDLNNNVLPEPERLLPALDKVAADERVIDIARQRARALAERIRISQTQTH